MAQRARHRKVSRSPAVLSAVLFKLFVWSSFAAVVGAIVVACFWSRIRVMPIFRITAFQLVGCPVPGQPEMRRLLAPFVGRSVFDVPAIATHLDAKLKAVPELRNVRFVRHWPNEVEVRIKGREPVAVARTGDTWLSVDDDGIGMRYYRNPPISLMAVQGLSARMEDGRPAVSREQLALMGQVRDAAKRVLGAAPRSVDMVEGGAVHVRLMNGDTIRLGQVDQLQAKFQVYRAVRANHDQPVAYVDVSDPSVPALRAAPKPPPPAPKADPPAEPKVETKVAKPVAKPAVTKPAPAKPRTTTPKAKTTAGAKASSSANAKSSSTKASTSKPSAAKPKATPSRSAATKAKTSAANAKTGAKPKSTTARAKTSSTKTSSTKTSSTKAPAGTTGRAKSTRSSSSQREERPKR